MKTKLDYGQKHMLKLIHRDADKNGWAPVSAMIFPLVSKTMPAELIELEPTGNDGRGRVRLTDTGKNILMALDWL